MNMMFGGVFKRPRKMVPLTETLPWKIYCQRADQSVPSLRSFNPNINSKLYIYLGSITDLDIDSIVNAANNSLLGGGGVDGAIHASAGPDLKNECRKLGGCSTGDAKITAGHKLPASHIIHTVGPRGRNPEVLKASYERCYELMSENKLKSIAFPCISTGVYGYPNKAAAEVAIETTRDFLEANHDSVEGVVFCLFTKQDISAYHTLLPAFFPFNHKESSEADNKEECGETSEEKTSEPASSAEVLADVESASQGDVPTEDTAPNQIEEMVEDEPASQTEVLAEDLESAVISNDERTESNDAKRSKLEVDEETSRLEKEPESNSNAASATLSVSTSGEEMDKSKCEEVKETSDCKKVGNVEEPS